MKRIPSRLLSSSRRRILQKKASMLLKRMDKSIPISHAYVMGSFMTKKKNPYDIDFAILVKTPLGSKMKDWSADFVIAPDNAYGKKVLKELQLWMSEKYGKRSVEFLKLK